MFMSLSLKEKNQDVINQAIRELQRAANTDTPTTTSVTNANYSILPSDWFIDGGASPFTANRTWTLPPISSVTPGQVITLEAFANGHSLIVMASGSDQLYNLVAEGASSSSMTFTGTTVELRAIAVPRSGTSFWFVWVYANAALARSIQGLNVESFTAVGDTNYSILPTDRVINQTVTLTATRTWTFPLVSSVPQGYKIKFISVGADPTLTFNLILATQAPDTFFIEQTFQVPTSITLNSIQNSFEATAFNNGGGNTFWSINFDTDKDWSNFTPSPNWAGGAPTATISTVIARYSQRGTTVAWAVTFTIGASGSTGQYILFTGPPAPSFPRYPTGGGGRESTIGKGLGVVISSGVNGGAINQADVTAFSNSATVIASGTYEAN